MQEDVLTDENTESVSVNKLVFEYLPGYAKYLRENCLVPYIEEQIRISRAINLPMLRFFEGMTDDQLITMGIESHREFLTNAEQNTLRDLMERSLNRWLEDRIGILKREDIAAEDITYAGYIRKRAMLKFLSSYTSDVDEAVAIVREIDTYALESDTAAMAIYMTIQKDKRQTLIDKLQDSDILFKQAQARTHIGNWTWDIPANKVTWSDEMYRVYGLEPQSVEVTYETYLSRIHPEDRENRIKEVQHVFETGEPEDHHYRILTPDGTVKILHTKSELQYGNDGKPLRMMGTCQDITDKQLLIERLQRSEELYKQAQAISHMGNWTWDFETKKIQWSDEIYRIYELPPQSLEDSFDLNKYNHPEDNQMISDTISNAIKSFTPFDFIYRIVLDKGVVKTLHAIGDVQRSKPGAYSIIGTLQDITEQKRVEKQLKDYKDFIQKITDVTPSIIATYNVHTGVYSFINKAVEKLLGYPAEKIMEEGVAFTSSLLHPDDMQTLVEKNAKALEEANAMGFNDNEPIAEFKYRMRHKKGHYRWLHTFGTVFERNENGLVESVLNISVDITEQETAEQALHQKNIELEQSNTSLEEYAYVASHDLKEPLRKIATFSDRLLTTQTSLGEDGKIFLTKIIDSSRRMQKMINDLLSVSTILGNKAYEHYDLNAAFDEALHSLSQQIEDANAVITADVLPTVVVVPSQFKQLFQNLISNSLKFARKDVPSEIRITHRFIGPKDVQGRDMPKAKKYLQLSFSDNGIGFDNKYVDKIFAIFQRLHGRSEYEGTGIGLAVCKKIAENHNGIILADGVVNEGAVFKVIIPV